MNTPIEYDVFDDCERVTINFGGCRVRLGFDCDEDLAQHLVACGYPAEIQDSVFDKVRAHRLSDQFDYRAPERAPLQERPAGDTDEAGSKPAGFACHGGRLLRSNSRLKWTVCFLAWVAAYLAWRQL